MTLGLPGERQIAGKTLNWG